jgi:iron-sulfur cluster insertion protein
MTPSIQLTPAAQEKVQTLMADDGRSPDTTFLRMYITGGGCSGFEYGFTLDEAKSDDDTILAFGPVSLVVDPMSLQYLQGAEVDYKEGLDGAQFVIKNPNATSTCGCGSSFSA